MPDRYVHRNSEQRLRDLVAGLRVVIVNGPRLIRAIKIIVDRSQDRGQFILSGSARFLAIPTLSESLAGRAGFLDLPLSLSERTAEPADFTIEAPAVRRS